jgi:hypothetical protein
LLGTLHGFEFNRLRVGLRIAKFDAWALEEFFPRALHCGTISYEQFINEFAGGFQILKRLARVKNHRTTRMAIC